MSFQVENTWIEILEKYGNKTPEDAKAYWEKIKSEGRYQKDVY
jgi:sulfite reductase alpha subunit-like flavoprotein